jgi:putative ABC transport system permease protein
VKKENLTKRPMRLLLFGLALRNLRVRPGRTCLTLLGITLGVAAVLATSITNRNATNTLAALFERTVGNAELEIIPKADETTLAEMTLNKVKQQAGVELAVASVQTSTIFSGSADEGQSAINASGIIDLNKSVMVEGIDPVLDPQMRIYTLISGAFPKLGEYKVLITETFAAQNELNLGEHLIIYGAEGIDKLEVSGILADEGAAMINGGNVLFLPIDIAQAMFNLENEVSKISIQAHAGIGNDPDKLAQLKAALEARVNQSGRVIYPAARADQVPRMSNAYQLILAFFSIIAIIMGVFLIYNSFATTIIERTQEIGVLRAIGMGRWQILGQIFLEAIILSFFGSLLGIGFGLILSQGLMHLMRGFFEVESSVQILTLPELIKSSGLGFLGTIVSAILPARQAAAISPVEALTVFARSGKKIKAFVWQGGAALLGIGFIFLSQPGQLAPQWVLTLQMSAFVSVMIGAVLTIPLIMSVLEVVTTRISTWLYGVMGSLGARNLRRSVVRVMVTVASLVISLIMIIEVDSLVHVLKQDVSTWLEHALGADLLVYAPQPMRLSFAQTLESIPGIQAVSASRTIEVEVAVNSVEKTAQSREVLNFVAIDPDQFLNVANKEFISGQGDPDKIWHLMRQGKSVLISSVVAEMYHLKQGDEIILYTRQGLQAFEVAGITTEFNESGLIITGTFPDLRYFISEKGADMFAIDVHPNYKPLVIAQQIEHRYEKREGIQVQSTVTYKESVMNFYDRLTSLFHVLSLLGIIIGTLGLLNTMTMNILERKRELGMMRSLGSLPKQIRNMILAEALSMGVISALYGIVFGYILSRVLLNAANLISGYDLQFDFNLRPYLLSLLIALGISQFATLIPARYASRLNIIQALKHE